MRLWAEKFKEVSLSILPITVLVLLLSVTIIPLDNWQLGRFLLGALFIILGLTIFLVGVDLGVTPLGLRLGEIIVRRNRLWIVVAAGLVLGFFISVAEPDLHILANQVDLVTDGLIGKWPIVVVVSAGIAVLATAGLIRILFNFPLYKMLTILYGLILLLALFASPEFLAISFDASGATTGAMTVPFILALALGIAAIKKNSKDSEKDSFGLVAIASAGAILAVLIMSLPIPGGDFAASVDLSDSASISFLQPFFRQLGRQSWEAALAIMPLAAILLIGQVKVLRLSRRQLQRQLKGLAYTWLGLILMLTGVNAGFMAVGREIGSRLALRESKFMLVAVGFLLGLLTNLAEPAVHVLTDQIEAVTSGSVRKSLILLVLATGVGLAVTLSVLRILIPPLQLWHILLPGYLLALILAHIGSKLFVGIGFDSGGVASGPMTATFILAYCQGAANSVQSANVLIDGFGVIALVALTPIITLQVLGLAYRRQALRKGGVRHGR